MEFCALRRTCWSRRSGTGNKIPGHESKKRIRELYLAADPHYEQRCTVPIIWDNKLNTIVNNESSEVIRNLNYAFDEFLPSKYQGLTFYPDELKSQIDEMNEWVYPTINNGVYKCGFATKQDAYEANVKPLFDSLDRVESHLSDGRQYLFGGKLTEADIRLYTTIVRFDRSTLPISSATTAPSGMAIRRSTGGCRDCIGTKRRSRIPLISRASRRTTSRVTPTSTRTASSRRVPCRTFCRSTSEPLSPVLPVT